jgi:hypothetical protein
MLFRSTMFEVILAEGPLKIERRSCEPYIKLLKTHNLVREYR